MIDEKKLAPAREQFKLCSDIFIALGDLVRQQICLDLAAAGPQGINVVQLSQKTTLSRPAVSHHLKVLKEAKIVEPIKNGTQIFYRLKLRESLNSVKNLITMIDEILSEEGMDLSNHSDC